MTITVGCPVRRRAWVLPTHLRALECLLAPPGCDLSYHFVVQPGPDDTERIVAAWCGQEPARRSWGLCTGAPVGWRRAAGPAHYDYRWLADLRNLLIRAVPEGTLFSCDSDVLPAPTALLRLWAGDGDVVGAPVSNSPGLSLGDPRCAGNWEPLPGGRPGVPTRRTPVAWTGACALYRAHALAVGWRAHPRGEDVGLCEALRAAGGTVYVEPLARARHVMRPQDL